MSHTRRRASLVPVTSDGRVFPAALGCAPLAEGPLWARRALARLPGGGTVRVGRSVKESTLAQCHQHGPGGGIYQRGHPLVPGTQRQGSPEKSTIEGRPYGPTTRFLKERRDHRNSVTTKYLKRPAKGHFSPCPFSPPQLGGDPRGRAGVGQAWCSPSKGTGRSSGAHELTRRPGTRLCTGTPAALGSLWV